MRVIFYPAIKLFNKLNLLAKFLLISSVLVLLIGVAAYQYFSSVDSYIQFNSKEVIGAQYSKESKSLMIDALKYRDNYTQTTNLAEMENRVKLSLNKLGNLDQYYKNALDDTASNKVVSKDIADCSSAWKKALDQPLEDHWSVLFDAINKLHTDISDNSNLTLDPDLDSYYCMDVVMFRSLSLFQNLYDQKNYLQHADFTKWDTNNIKCMAEFNTQLKILSDTIIGDMKTAFNFNNSKKLKTLKSLTKEIDQLTLQMDELEKELDSITTSTDKLALTDLISKSIETNSNMFNHVNDKMLDLLNIRVDHYQKNKTFFIIDLLVAIPIIIYIYIAFMMSITGNIRKINAGLKRISDNDLTENIHVESKDELGSVGDGFNYMLENLKNTLRIISSTADNVGETVENVNHSIIRFDDKLKQISDTIENLSGSSEELAASAVEIETTTGNLDVSALSMQDKAKACLLLAEDINEKTRIATEGFKKAKKKTEQVLDTTEEELTQSLVAVKAVDQIHVLSEAIMEITSQTNLLALNASIEAARAGEAGRGFSVVADEVKKLAEQSNQTAIKIKEVVERIASSVNELTINSMKMMSFIKTNVIVEYGNVILLGDEFAKNANSFQEFSKSVSALSDNLSHSVQVMVGTISEMAKANNYSASEIQTIVTDIIELKNASGIIVDEVNSVADNMIILEKESKQFVM